MDQGGSASKPVMELQAKLEFEDIARRTRTAERLKMLDAYAEALQALAKVSSYARERVGGGGTCVVTEPPQASGIASPSCGGRAAERGGNREWAA